MSLAVGINKKDYPNLESIARELVRNTEYAILDEKWGKWLSTLSPFDIPIIFKGAKQPNRRCVSFRTYRENFPKDVQDIIFVCVNSLGVIEEETDIGAIALYRQMGILNEFITLKTKDNEEDTEA